MSFVMVTTMTQALQSPIRLRDVWAPCFHFLITEPAYQLVAVMSLGREWLQVPL